MAPGGGQTIKSDEEILQLKREKTLNKLLKKEKVTLLGKILKKLWN